MELILKTEIVTILNQIQRGDAPPLVENEIVPVSTELSDYKFDLVDSKDNPIRSFETGTAHYINGEKDNNYTLKIILYDGFIHQFTYDDGKGNPRVNRLKDGIKVSDFLVYETSEDKIYFIVHEISEEDSKTKSRAAKKQLSDTLNQLYKSDVIAHFIDGFKNKLCIYSANDSRQIESPEGMADGFNEIFKILPEPIKFNWGQIGTYGFSAFETSYVHLEK